MQSAFSGPPVMGFAPGNVHAQVFAERAAKFLPRYYHGQIFSDDFEVVNRFSKKGCARFPFAYDQLGMPVAPRQNPRRGDNSETLVASTGFGQRWLQLPKKPFPKSDLSKNCRVVRDCFGNVSNLVQLFSFMQTFPYNRAMHWNAGAGQISCGCKKFAQNAPVPSLKNVRRPVIAGVRKKFGAFL